MKLRTVLLWGFAASLLLQSSCQTPVEPEEEESKVEPVATRVSGTVIRNDNLTAVPNVIVYDLAGLARDTTKNDGSYRLTYQLTSRYSGRIVAMRAGFGSDTASVSLDPGRDTTITLRIKADSLSPSTGPLTTKAANIVLIGSTDRNIAIRGSGMNETVFLTFEVRDSLGVPVGAANKVRVDFTIRGGPGGGEYIFPVSEESDPLTGRVTTRVTSGTKAGVLQVYASTTIGTQEVKSSPVRITITGGLPTQERFSISRQFANIAGGVFDNLRNRIQVVVGDKFGNPVALATAVYFTTSGGIIQGRAETNADGIAAVDLISGNPRPPGGIAMIRAETVGENGVMVRDSIPVLFSGATRITAPAGPFEIQDGESYTLPFRVGDVNGMPLVAGSTVRVTVTGPGSGGLEVLGDNNVTMPDTDSPLATFFSVTLRDKEEGGVSGAFTVTIEVTSQNGNTKHTLSGKLLEKQDVVVVPPSARQPAQIRTFPPTATAIDIAGVGGLENSVLTYEVLDSLGVPIDASRRVYARFRIEFFPNSFVGGGTAPRVIPGADSSDNNGRLRASVVSGTQAGVVQLVAEIDLPDGRRLRSEPTRIVVRAGDPTRSHFDFTTDAYVFAMPSTGFGPTFFVQVADTFSNPVAQGTAVYFHTWAGNIQPSVATDVNGRGAVRFLGGSPAPTAGGSQLAGRQTYFGREGVFWVVAQTAGRDGKKVTDSIRVAWAVGPVRVTGLPDTSLPIPRAGTSPPVNISVRDGLNNPLPVGTRITVRIEFTTDVSGIKFAAFGGLSSDEPFIMPNGPYIVDPGPGVTEFSLRVTDLSLNGAPVGQRIVVKIIVEAPNIGSGPSTFSFSGVVQ